MGFAMTFISSFLGNKKAVKITVITVLIFALILWISSSLKSRKEKKEREKTEPNIDTDKTTQEDSIYRAIAFRLKNAFEGVGVTTSQNTEQTAALRALNELNDDEFKLVYKYFNDLVEPPETLREWINGEWMPFSFQDGIAIDRMNELKLA